MPIYCCTLSRIDTGTRGLIVTGGNDVVRISALSTKQVTHGVGSKSLYANAPLFAATIHVPGKIFTERVSRIPEKDETD